MTRRDHPHEPFERGPLEELPQAPPPAGEVHLYSARLDPAESVVAACEGLLSPAERYLAGRKVTEELRRLSIVSRGFLRSALGSALERPGSDVQLGIGEHGKPFLVEPEDAPRLDFNLSHSGNWWLLAMVESGPVGVDIETPRDETDWDALVDRYFSRAEGTAFRALPPDRRKAAFFRTWTAKEAFLKARGSGLATPLASFDVEVDPDRPLALREVRQPGVLAHTWWLAEVPGLELPAAVAGKGPAPTVRMGELPTI